MNSQLERPRLKPLFTANDQLIETLGWVIIMCSFAFTCFAYFQLSGTIPVHFNHSGEPDGYGDKATLFFLPAASTVMYWGLTYLNKYPSIFNYLTPVTPDNAIIQYTLYTRIIRILKTAVTGVFAYLIALTYCAAKGVAFGLDSMPSVLTITCLFGPLIFASIKIFLGR